MAHGQSGSGPALTVSATCVEFGVVPLNTPAPLQTVTLTSTGTAPLTISATALAGPTAFRVSGASFPLTLNPGDTATLTFGFDAGLAGAKTGTLTLTTNAAIPTTKIALSGTAVAAGLTVTTDTVSFGDVPLSTAAPLQTVTVTSSGSVPLTISSLTLNGPSAFSVSGASFPLTLNPGDAATLSLGFDASTAGAKSGSITLRTDASPSTTTIALSGTAVAAGLTLSANAVSFGSVPVSTAAATQSVTLTSSSSVPLTISSLTLSGPSAFSVSGASFPLTLPPGGTATLTFGFDANLTGAKSATVTLRSNTSPTITTLTLTGTAVTPGVLSGISCSSGSMTGAGTDACTVTLTAPAGNGGLAVSLGSNNASVSVPASVTVPADTASATFSAGIAAVTTAESVTLTATAGSAAANFSLQLNAAVAMLMLSSTSVDFGNVTLGSPATQTVMLMSTGTVPVTVNGASVSGPGFSASGVTQPVTLNPGDQATLNVQFDPTVAGASTGSVAVSTNCSMGAMAISVSGTGMTPANEISLSWDAPSNPTEAPTGYNVYREASTDTAYTLLNSISNGATAYVDTAVVSGTTYNYYVTSIDGLGNESAPSNPTTVSVL
ncbi:MAG TPA: choice-of-anchor D domain-containing protein [Acidobacteriaceae bacterium]|nr:choice-of-anchor D domain-containing protein [Acidobacteriaceae bacterium]